MQEVNRLTLPKPDLENVGGCATVKEEIFLKFSWVS